MRSEEEKLVHRRVVMLSRDLRDRGITDPAVLEAFRSVPREMFVPDGQRLQAYADHPLPIGNGQTISQPYIVARSLQELGVETGMKVLDVGAGSGYQSALLAAMGARVVGIERIDLLAAQARQRLERLGYDNVQIVVADGSDGYPPEAPYDRIVCGAACPELPAPWIQQLREGGRMVLPVGDRDVQTLQAVTKTGSTIQTQNICGVRFVPLLGTHGWKNPSP